jgi:hypothetical protein
MICIELPAKHAIGDIGDVHRFTRGYCCWRTNLKGYTEGDVYGTGNDQ